MKLDKYLKNITKDFIGKTLDENTLNEIRYKLNNLLGIPREYIDPEYKSRKIKKFLKQIELEQIDE